MHHHEALARRIIAEIEQMTDGRPMRWVALQQVARRLQIRRTFVARWPKRIVDCRSSGMASLMAFRSTFPQPNRNSGFAPIQ